MSGWMVTGCDPPSSTHKLFTMKFILSAAVCVLALTGCASHHASDANYIRIRSVAPDADNTQSWFPKAFKVGNQRFGTLEDFKAFVVTLPPGSVLRWNSGCIGYNMMPLAYSDMTIQAFTDFCREHGITFVHIISGY